MAISRVYPDTYLFSGLKAPMSGNIWPVIPKANAATMLSILSQLEFSQWYSQERLMELQFRQLRELLKFSIDNIPYYRSLLADSEYKKSKSLDIETWLNIPILLRSDISTFRRFTKI